MPPLLRPTPEEILAIRTHLGLGRAEFANVLGMPASGEQTVIGWEAGRIIPPYAKRKAILNMEKSYAIMLRLRLFDGRRRENSVSGLLICLRVSGATFAVSAIGGTLCLYLRMG